MPKKNKPNDSYWSKRSAEMQDKAFQEAEDYLKTLNEVYQATMQKYDEKIFRQLEQFAKAEDTSINQALKALNARQQAGFNMDVREYIKLGKANNWSSSIVKAMEKASAQYHINHYQAMQVQMEAISADLWAKHAKSMKGFLGGQYQKTYYNMVKDIQEFKGRYDSVSGINKSLLEKILEESWAPDKRTFTDRIFNNQAKLTSSLKKELALHVTGTQSLKQASNNIAKAMDTSYGNASRLAYGELNRLLNRGSLDGMKEAGADKYQYVSTLDGRTTRFCQALDGKVFKFEEFEEGVTAPPHPGGNCRSRIKAIFDDGIKINETRLSKVPIGEGKEEYRLVSNGLERINYKEWKEKYVKSF